MVIPLGKRYQQTLTVLRKVHGKLEHEALEPTFFVPMTGKAEQLRDLTGEPTDCQLVNRSCEVADYQGYLRAGITVGAHRSYTIPMQ